MAAAAEKRLQQEEGRGMKDPEGYKKKLEQRERAEQEANQRADDAPLKVIIVYLVVFGCISTLLLHPSFRIFFSGKCHDCFFQNYKMQNKESLICYYFKCLCSRRDSLILNMNLFPSGLFPH